MKPYWHKYLSDPNYAVYVSADGGHVEVQRLKPVRLADLVRHLKLTPLWFWEET